MVLKATISCISFGTKGALEILRFLKTWWSIGVEDSYMLSQSVCSGIDLTTTLHRTGDFFSSWSGWGSGDLRPEVWRTPCRKFYNGMVS